MSEERYDEYDSREAAIERARQTGSMWLNDSFKFRDDTIRIFGKRGPRISKLEIFWSIVVTILTAAVLIPGYIYVGTWGPLIAIFHPIAIFCWSLIVGWQGRRLAHMSPYRRKTGEGMGTYISVLLKHVIVWVGDKLQRPVMYNQCLSIAGNTNREEEVVRCVEWIGTARAPRMPRNYDPKKNADLQEFGETLMETVYMPPRGRVVPLTERQRQRIREELETGR